MVNEFQIFTDSIDVHYLSYKFGNLNLNIVSKRKINNLHQIESLVALIDLADEIKISEIRSKKHKVIFRGKYSKGIPKFNTITHLLALLEKEKIIKKKYRILVKKNIPKKSGMGGGSMNAASILSFFLLSQNRFASKVFISLGRDVTCEIRLPLSMKIWSSIVNPILSPEIYFFFCLRPSFK